MDIYGALPHAALAGYEGADLAIPGNHAVIFELNTEKLPYRKEKSTDD
jgi:hypothetical protein